MTETTKTTTKPVPKLEHASLAAALAAVQAEIPSVAKGATAEVKTNGGGSYSYSYADLAVITPIILPLLGKNGLAWTTRPTLVGDAFILDYQLMHESGESIEGVYPLQNPTSARPQEIGSAITYARRYALCAVTGIAPGGDDDDAAAANTQPATSRTPRAQKPNRDWKKAIADTKTLDALTLLANEAQAEGHWADTITDDAGETTVGQALHARRQRIEEAAEPLVGGGKETPRAWLDEAKDFMYSDEAAELLREATALGANKRILDSLTGMAESLPSRPVAEGAGAAEWAPVVQDEDAPAVLDETIEPEPEQ